jgi:3-oxoadipate enol-lactonase
MDVEAGLGTIRAPTLVIAAAQDTSIPPEHGRAVAAAIPGARFELVDPGAHLVAWERPEPVAALMREHLGR